MSSSVWFTTVAAIRAAEPEWEAIASYREPVRRFLLRAWPRLDPELREDVLQETLVALKSVAVARYDAGRGRFRDYLVGVVRNQVRRACAAAGRHRPLEEEATAPLEAAADPVDLEARLIRAVRRAHDALARGGDEERQTLWCFADRLLEGLTYPEIAAKEGLSLDAVKRRLQAARRGVLRALLEEALEQAGVGLAARPLGKLAEAFQEALTRGCPLEQVAARRTDPAALAAAEALRQAVREGLRWFPGLDAPDGQAFVCALRAVLEEQPR